MLDHLSEKTASIVLSAGIFAAAVGLLFWLRFERSRRDDDEDLTEADRAYFSRQDTRRNAGLAILLLLAQGIAISPHIDRRAGDRPNSLFLFFWLAVFFLILVLLILAFLDMIATRVYAKRHREAILRERNALVSELEEIARRERADRQEEGSKPDPDSASE